MQESYGWLTWVIEKGGALLKIGVSFLKSVFGFVGQVLSLGDWAADRARENARLEIGKRLDAFPDDAYDFEWARAYLRKNYGEVPPL